MIINASCQCGNEDVRRFHEYDGALGYEAIICLICKRYYDNTGEHAADKWSKQFVVSQKLTTHKGKP